MGNCNFKAEAEKDNHQGKKNNHKKTDPSALKLTNHPLIVTSAHKLR